MGVQGFAPYIKIKTISQLCGINSEILKETKSVLIINQWELLKYKNKSQRHPMQYIPHLTCEPCVMVLNILQRTLEGAAGVKMVGVV